MKENQSRPALPEVVDSVLSLIGNTPMIRIRAIDTGPCELYVKLENQNPGGSIKDRMALAMIEAAEREGKLKPGGTIVEATAGNTGLGLALVASQKGYQLILVIPDKMSQEKIFHLRAMGAQVILTRSDVNKGHPEYYMDLARTIAEQRGALYVNQFENPANPIAHEQSTAPEIWEQMHHRLDAVVAGVGSGGTLAGIAHFFKKTAPNVEVILADPAGSGIADIAHGKAPGCGGTYLVEGIGGGFLPPVGDLSGVKTTYTIPDAETFETARELLRKEGILAGSSAGTLVAAALRYCRAQKQPKRVVTLICDSGNKYLSKMYNDYWMIDQGFIQRETFGDLRDLISRRHWEGATVTIGPDDMIQAAYRRMRLYDISQLPVIESGKVVGILDESDILAALTENKDAFGGPVRATMTSHVQTVSSKSEVESLIPIFKQGRVAVVVDPQGAFLGLITQIDLIHFMRAKQR
ncbi:MAG: pyridoxal-phosphate dependent enzyme [Oligoflexia bacterium]|nr:pyridoxal-phosphate dependent enzyme [Oligoflexia bacterium]